MKKLWSKNDKTVLNKAVEAYTIGNDYILDTELIPFDVQGSMAHAKMLKSIGILSDVELQKLLKGLAQLLEEWKRGKFVVGKEHEDGHSAIEFYLTKNYGEVGKKIHTGRSRNDQILVTLRLYSKARLQEIMRAVNRLVKTFSLQSKKWGTIKMPGYTHMQRAMPSSVGMWLGSYAESLEDDLQLIVAVQKIIDQNPLGSAASFGETVLGIDREFTAKEMGFAKVQKNPMYCALSRGKFENMILQALSHVVFDLGKMASDLLLFTTKEFGFFDLPEEFKTGSSIMPQKKNFDVLELMRANVSVFYAQQYQVQEIIKNLPSGYNRDFQLTKEPFMKGLKLVQDMLAIFDLILNNLVVNKEKLAEACSSELYATEKVYKRVKKGEAFRDAYRSF